MGPGLTAQLTEHFGLLVLTYYDFPATAPVVPGVVMPGGIRGRMLTEVTEESELVRLPDIDGTTKTMWYSDIGILTQSERPDQPPDEYAVAVLSNGQDRSFVMRRFLSQTGKWDKIVGLPSPLPLARPMDMYIAHEAMAFAGRLWWVDVARGALSVDPFSNRTELRFVELRRGSVTDTWTRRSDGICAEVSQEEPFLLSSFTLDDDGSCWTLEQWHYADSGRMKTCWLQSSQIPSS
uniref:DUF1618 domain-containing protein n=1 Tax=Setaria italica TaxID=4555 RepID=K4A3G2_SETIT